MSESCHPDAIDDDGHDLIIVSDLHLSEGSDRATGQWDFREDFLQDDAFDRFVTHLIDQRRSSERPLRLIILGDFIEYLQINVDGLEEVYGSYGEDVPNPYDRHRSEEEAVRKTDRVLAGHPTVFTAIGRFVEAGHRLTIVAGNHDIELAWPHVQERLAFGIAAGVQRIGDEAFANRIEFEPWFFYRQGIVYADHGHQFDRMNANDRQLDPRNVFNPELFDLPLGSWLVYHAYNRIERIDAVADNVKPMSAYLSWALAHRGYTAVQLIGSAILSYRVVRKGYPKRTRAEFQDRRRTYQESDLFTDYAASKRGLPPAITKVIDDLHDFYHGRTWLTMVLGRQVVSIGIGLIVAVIALVCWTLVAWHAGIVFQTVLASNGTIGGIFEGGIGDLFQVVGFVATFVTGLVALVAGGRQLGAVVADIVGAIRQSFTEHYLIRTARELQNQVIPCSLQPRAYVFGHNHQPAVVNLVAGSWGGGTAGSERLYINTGTWTPIIDTHWQLLGERDTLTFALITVDRERDLGQEVQASLMVWNDQAQRIEPFRDLAGPKPVLLMEPHLTQTAEASRGSALTP